MSSVWQIQNAKNKLSEVITRALTEGPQLITRHGEKTVVVLSYVDYEKMRKSQEKLSEFFQKSPLAEVQLTRDKTMLREEVKL